jgi:hypothetical protein
MAEERNTLQQKAKKSSNRNSKGEICACAFHSNSILRAFLFVYVCGTAQAADRESVRILARALNTFD